MLNILWSVFPLIYNWISKDHDMSRDSAQVRGNCDWSGH